MAKAPAKKIEEEVPDVAEQQDASVKNTQKKKMILLAAIVAVLIVVSVGGTIAVVKMMGGGKKGEAAASTEAAQGEHAEAVEQAEKMSVTYLPMDPAFLTNYAINGRPRYLQLSLTLASRDKATLDAVQKHMPLVRNRIVMLLSGEQFETLRSRAGREALLVKLQDAIKAVLEKEGTTAAIDRVLFTNFVMQ